MSYKRKKDALNKFLIPDVLDMVLDYEIGYQKQIDYSHQIKQEVNERLRGIFQWQSHVLGGNCPFWDMITQHSYVKGKRRKVNNTILGIVLFADTWNTLQRNNIL